MQKQARVLTVALVLAGAGALGAHALAGGVGNTVNTALLEKNMGIRVLAITNINGKKVDAQVVDADRFAKRGFPGAAVNDKVTIMSSGEKKGTVKHEKSGKALEFSVKDDGTIVRE